MSTPKFFLPAASDDAMAEREYANLAAFAGTAVPQRSARIFSMRFTHDGEEWTATVGEPLSGATLKRKGRSSRAPVVRTTPLSDPAIVLAIFASVPYRVVTIEGIACRVGSKWSNPFLAQPDSITYFASDSP